ncbi:hypothetical protein EVAR_3112_1 [Eumeta japonica]|uniref:Uncharacterized protein n=1 Tax=Eumeta variegata TaxID=151549 RepID=A0A4C1XH32_EUMVA|nr:hypothetical protein EVAR_3112_1 [Eumeta japonica]
MMVRCAGVVTPPLLIGLKAAEGVVGGGGVGVRLAFVLCHLVPAHSISSAVYGAVHVARLNALCALNLRLCPAIPALDDGFDVTACCGMLHFFFFYLRFVPSYAC